MLAAKNAAKNLPSWARDGGKGLPTLDDVLAQKNAAKANGNLPSWARGGGGLPTLDEVLSQKNAAKAAPQHHDHGILHAVEHAAGQTVTDLYNTAVHSPKGMYETGKAVAEASLGNYKPLEKIGKATAEGTVQDFKHPLRHPGNTLLDVGSVLSMGAGTAARVGEVGRALEAGEGAGAVVEGALKGPKPETRSLEYDGATVHAGTYSRSAALRATQKLFDRFHERFPEIRPLPFGVRTLPERVAKELTTSNRFRENLGRAPAAELTRLGKGLSTPKQVALRVVAEGVPIADRIAFHAQQLPSLKGRAARASSRQLELLKSARSYVHDVEGMPRIRPEHEDLIHVYEATRSAAKLRERRLADTTRVVRGPDKSVSRVPALDDAAAAGREQAPGRIVKGARFVPATAARLGKSPALNEANRNAARLQKRFDALYEKQRGKIVEGSRPRTAEEAQQHLAELEREHNAQLDKLTTEMFPPADKGEVAYRNLHNARAKRQQSGVDRLGRPSGASGRKLDVMPTVREERRREVERMVEETIAKHPDHPSAARWRDRVEQIDQLRAALNPDLFEKVDAGKLGEVATARFVRRHGKLQRVGGALSIAKDRAQRLEEQAAKRVEPTGLVGAEDFADGKFRVPYVAKQPKGALYKPAGWKGGNERAPGTTTHAFTGALLKHGVFRNDTTRLVAESYLEAHRFAALVEHRDEFLRFSHDVPQSDHDVPIRLDALKDKPWPSIVQRFEDDNRLTGDEVQAMGHAYESLRGDLFPDKDAFVGEPEAHPDVRWIDSRLLGGINEPNPLVGIVGAGRTALHAADTVNNASRLAILYLKPAYAIPNIVGNSFLTLVQQGWAAPRNLALAARLNQRLGANLAAKVDTVMGEGLTAALHTEEGPLQTVTNVSANFWQKFVDTPFRRAAFLHEARRFGYKTPADLRQLFEDDHRLMEVVREANAELIDYGRMGRYERNIIRRVVFFYPWVKGSSVYAARFLGTHPQQAALLGQMGKQGAAQDASELGPVPSYADGVFKVGERHGMPLVLNPSAAGILETPAQLLQTVRDLGSKHPGQAFQFGQNFTPALQAALALTAGQGVRPNESHLAGAERQLVGGLPIVSTAEGLLHPPAGSSRPRLYPRTRRDVLLHYLLGGLAPTPLNKGVAQRAKYREDHPR